jgi:hypothetical protein
MKTYPIIRIDNISFERPFQPICSLFSNNPVAEVNHPTIAKGSFISGDYEELHQLLYTNESSRGFVLIPVADWSGKPVRVIDEETYERLIAVLITEEEKTCNTKKASSQQK